MDDQQTVESQGVEEADESGLDALLDHIKVSRGFDFTGYKKASLGRRIQKRLQARHVGSYDEYREVKHIHVDLGGLSRERHPWWDITVPKRPSGSIPERPGPSAGEDPSSKPAG